MSSLASAAVLDRPREFFHIGRVVPLDQDIISVGPDAISGQAVQIMRRTGFSQLPVISSGRVLGAVTWRSICLGISSTTLHGLDLGSIPVIELLEDLKFVRPRDDLKVVLPYLDSDGSVLIGDEDRLQAIATTYDVTRYLWATTQPFILIQDIELALRDLLNSACRTDHDVEVCIQRAGVRTRIKKPTFNDLTLGGLLLTLKETQNFESFFATVFGRTAELVVSQLEPVREIRNKVFHFDGSFDDEDLETLNLARRWIQRKLDIRAGG